MEFVLQNLNKIILSVIAVVMAVLVIKNYAKIKKFIWEVRAELNKVHWSSKQELMGATVVVITITGLTAIYIGVIDLWLSKLLSILFR